MTENREDGVGGTQSRTESAPGTRGTAPPPFTEECCRVGTSTEAPDACCVLL